MRVDMATSVTAKTPDDVAEPVLISELRLIFASTPLAVRTALKSTMSGLQGMNLSDDDSSTIELVLAEVMNNVVEHAYSDDRQGIVELHLKHGPDGLNCAVYDDGFAMPHRVPPLSDAPDPTLPLDLQQEGGFGWYLIHELTQDLRYQRDGDRNLLSFKLCITRKVRAS